MGLLDSTSEEPRHKLRQYAISLVALVALLGYFMWHELRFQKEKQTVERFLGAVVSDQLQQAWQTWKPNPNYTFPAFLDDWGPNGYYGPVRSYRIASVEQQKNSIDVFITVDLSPDREFPDRSNSAAMNRVKSVRLYIERKDQSISFAP